MNPKTCGLIATQLAMLSLAAPVLAQNAAVDEPLLVVTASRFSESSLRAAANILTISREEIRASGAQTLPDVLRQKSSVHIKPLYGSLAGDTAVDMRGFGDGGSQRTLVLLNGQRLNPLDFSSVDWGSIPLESVERIEILSGSGAVMYGDNAVGGVINIITGKVRQGGSVEVGLGSDAARKLSATLNQNSDNLWFSLSANHQAVDGWRLNNSQERNNFSSRLGIKLDQAEVALDFGWSKIKLGLPGVLNEQQYKQNPRQAETMDSAAERTNAFFRPGIKWRINDTLNFAAEIAYNEANSESWISSYFSYDKRDTRTLSFTPRLRWGHGLGSLASSTTIGIDYYDGELTSKKAASPSAPITNRVSIDQKSKALYLQNSTDLSNVLTLTAGWRDQRIDQSAKDSNGLRLINNNESSISDIGLAYRITSGMRIVARTGSTFRFANLDELTTWTGFVSKPVRPEKGHFTDLGVQLDGTGYSAKLTAYRLAMTDEISYNNNTFENENLAKTLHQGLEFDGHYELNRQWLLGGGFNYQRAEFAEGIDRGKAIPLVPTMKANAGLTFKANDNWSILALANHVGSRYFGGDTANNFARMPSYTTMDVVLTWKEKNWTARLRGQNLFDKRYAATGYNYGSASYYPADGRSVFADLRYEF